MWPVLKATEMGRPLLSVQPLKSVGQETGVCCARGHGPACHLFKCCSVLASGRRKPGSFGLVVFYFLGDGT